MFSKKREASIVTLSAVVAISLAGLIAVARIAAAGTNAPVSAGFQRPLVIDMKLEKDVEELKRRVADLEAAVARIEKESRQQGKNAPASR